MDQPTVEQLREVLRELLDALQAENAIRFQRLLEEGLEAAGRSPEENQALQRLLIAKAAAEEILGR